MKKRGISLTLRLAAALIAAGIAVRVAPAVAADARPDPFTAVAAEKIASLGVTDPQKAQVKEIVGKYQPVIRPLARRFAAERRALRALIHAPTVDEPAIRAQASKVAGLGADLAVQTANFFHDLRGVFTPEQIRKIEEMQADGNARLDRLLGRIARGIAKE